ncbi:MAG: protein TolA, partial [Acinetobacter sp.]
MKQFEKPPFEKNAIAIGFTLGVHAVAIIALLYLGMSKPPEPPKKLKTFLVTPESLNMQQNQEAASPTLTDAPSHEAPAPTAPSTESHTTDPLPDTTPSPQQLQQQAQALAAKQLADTKAKQHAEDLLKKQAQAKAEAEIQRKQIEAKRQAEQAEKAQQLAQAKADAREQANADAKRKAAELAKQQAQQAKEQLAARNEAKL